MALVGESGCGKSTIASLLMERNRGYTGKIYLEEKELSKVQEQSLMQHITMVRHNSYLFKGTVEENLRMGNPKADRAQLEEALRKVNLWEFLKQQEGLQTVLQEKGSNFSGGQCQRLCIARALLHETPVYIFDEAASNIDMESEEIIMEVIRKLAETKTVLLISHRLANVKKSDCIYVLKNGKIAEQGKHEELLNLCGVYKKMYDTQRNLEKYGLEKEEKGKNSMKRRSGIKVMGQLIGLIFPLLHVMAAAILLGVAGFLCAIFLSILAGSGLVYGFMGKGIAGLSVGSLFVLMAVLAVLRGILHYAEQACNHYIAFKLLAIIRHKVFDALRRLCPAKLEGRDKGNLISIITNDIELLEVFYAHTISPIAIGFLTSLIMVLFLGHYHVYAGIWALISYLLVGVGVPLWNGKKGGQTGMEFGRAWKSEQLCAGFPAGTGGNHTVSSGKGQKRRHVPKISGIRCSAEKAQSYGGKHKGCDQSYYFVKLLWHVVFYCIFVY